MELKYSVAKLSEFKAVEGAGNGGFEGYGSVFGVRDDGGDIVLKGAFANKLDDFKTRGFIGLSHDWNGLPIGYVKEAREDDYGLFIQTEYHSHQMAQEARTVAQERIEAGKGVYLSIGYSVEPGGAAPSNDGMSRLLSQLKLYEVSQVNVPMLDVAEFTGVKAIDQGTRVLNLVKDYADRMHAIGELRTKEGRVLSSANRKLLDDLLGQLKTVAAKINELLEATTPKETEEDSAKSGKQLFAEFQRIQATLNGVL